MTRGVNFATLLGHVGKAPEIRGTGERRVASFSLATSESWRDRETGDRRERTEWHRVVIFGQRLVELVEKAVRKGSKLYLEGAIRTRSYEDKAKVERWVTEIVLSDFDGKIVLLDQAPSTRPPPATGVGDYGRTRSADRLAALNAEADRVYAAGEARKAPPSPAQTGGGSGAGGPAPAPFDDVIPF